jgi:hypothetical protein
VIGEAALSVNLRKRVLRNMSTQCAGVDRYDRATHKMSIASFPSRLRPWLEALTVAVAATSLSCGSRLSQRSTADDGGTTDAAHGGIAGVGGTAHVDDAGERANAGVGSGGAGTTGNDRREFVPLTGHYVFGEIDELSDLIAFANQVVLVTVVAETALPEPPGARERGLLLSRVVTLRVDASLWEPQPSEISRVAVGEAFEADVAGWVYTEGVRLPMVATSSVRIEPDGQYVMALVKFDPKVLDGVQYTQGWAPLTPEAVAPAKGSAVAQDDANRHGADAPLVAMLRDREPSDIADALAALPEDPKGEQVRHLPGAERAACYFNPDCPP